MALTTLRIGDRARAVVRFTYANASFVVERGALGRVSTADATHVGVVWDDNPLHMILPTSRHLLERDDAASWWIRYARAEIARPYERGFYAQYRWRVLLRQHRLAPLAFKLASVLDAKGTERIDRYPAAAKRLDEWGLFFEWLGV